MRTHHTFITALALTVAAIAPHHASALKPKVHNDSFPIPERAVVITGNRDNARHLVGVLYDTSDLHFSDPGAPRFLFLDTKGKVALGIGGYIKGTVQYDFNGAIDAGAGFSTFDIPVPLNPAQRNQFYGNINKSRLFLQLVGRSERFGYYQMYVQTEFSGGSPTSYGLRLKQAYVSVGYVTAGLARSTFVDPSAGTPVIDAIGPAGELFCNNILVRYAPRFSDHLSGAISVEMPQVSKTTDSLTRKINTRVPDIPAQITYQWDGGKSHIRAAALFRALSYRNLVTDRNAFAIGWSAQLSGTIYCRALPLTLFFQGMYGRGYGAYVNALSGKGYDLVPSDTPGKLVAPRMANFEIGARYDISPRLFLAACYSQANVFGTASSMGPHAYLRSNYISASAFFNITTDLRIGLEYLRGTRTDIDRTQGHANRLTSMLQFSF